MKKIYVKPSMEVARFDINEDITADEGFGLSQTFGEGVEDW